MCREWLVHEDGALAYRLQDEESKNIVKLFIKYYIDFTCSCIYYIIFYSQGALH